MVRKIISSFWKFFSKGKPLNIQSFSFGKLHLRQWSLVKQKVSSEKKCYYMISGKFASIITHKDFYPSALKCLTYYYPGFTHPCFLVAKTIPSLVKSWFQRFSKSCFYSYSINILPNYLNLLNLAHFPILENWFWWYDIQTKKSLNIHCFWFNLLNQVCFRICNSEILFFVLACYCLQILTQKQ